MRDCVDQPQITDTHNIYLFAKGFNVQLSHFRVINSFAALAFVLCSPITLAETVARNVEVRITTPIPERIPNGVVVKAKMDISQSRECLLRLNPAHNIEEGYCYSSTPVPYDNDGLRVSGGTSYEDGSAVLSSVSRDDWVAFVPGNPCRSAGCKKLLARFDREQADIKAAAIQQQEQKSAVIQLDVDVANQPNRRAKEFVVRASTTSSPGECFLLVKNSAHSSDEKHTSAILDGACYHYDEAAPFRVKSGVVKFYPYHAVAGVFSSSLIKCGVNDSCEEENGLPHRVNKLRARFFEERISLSMSEERARQVRQNAEARRLIRDSEQLASHMAREQFLQEK